MSRFGSCGLPFVLIFILAVLSVGAASLQEPVGEYVLVATARVGNSDFERSQHRPFKSHIATVFAFHNLRFVEFSYLKFDRKQNTRLWPFIFTGITRSPPAVNSNR
jgi:hypothetical protein